jgi:hypothetical protein
MIENDLPQKSPKMDGQYPKIAQFCSSSGVRCIRCSMFPPKKKWQFCRAVHQPMLQVCRHCLLGPPQTAGQETVVVHTLRVLQITRCTMWWKRPKHSSAHLSSFSVEWIYPYLSSFRGFSADRSSFGGFQSHDSHAFLGSSMAIMMASLPGKYVPPILAEAY